MKKLVFSFAIATAATFGFLSPAASMGKKALANKPESQIEIGGEEAPIAAKLIAGASTEVAAVMPSETAEAGAAKAGDLVAAAGGAATAPATVTAIAPGAAAAAAAGVATDAIAKPDIAKVPESQIPVLTGAKEMKKSGSGGYARVLITLGVLAALFGAIAFGLKRLASRRSHKNQNTKIRVLTTHALGPKKSIAIIQVAGESILVGVTDHNISMLKTLALIDDEVPEETPRHFEAALNGRDFDDAFDDAFAHANNEGGARMISTRQRKSLPAPVEHEEFAMRGLTEIRDKVSTRLKNMKNI